MVGQIVEDPEDLESFTTELAVRIAARPAFGLRLAKESVNHSLDAQGQSIALDSAIALHNLGHASNLARHGHVVDPIGVEVIRSGARLMQKALDGV